MSDEFHVRCIPQIWGLCLACMDLELHIKINNELFTSLPYPNEDVADSRQRVHSGHFKVITEYL